MNVTDEGKTKETQTEGWGNVEVSSVADEENEIKAKDAEGGMSFETRQSILKSLGISDEDAGISYREDKNKGLVRIQRGKWMLRMYNNSWSGARILIEEYSPKEVERSLVRNQVSHVYEIKYYKCMIEFFCIIKVCFEFIGMNI